jgi:hypothetical protein
MSDQDHEIFIDFSPFAVLHGEKGSGTRDRCVARLQLLLYGIGPPNA